jgi:glycosyltransferase involved in cell wall biosynthesis
MSCINQNQFDLLDSIIIVDYNSNDDTINIATKIFIKYKIKYLINIIERSGKSAALIDGLNISISPYTVILDDDNILFNDFFKNANTILNNNSQIGCLGSMGFIQDSLDIYPQWFNKYQGSFAIGLPEQGKYTDWVWGAASIINMRAWDQLKSKNFTFCLNSERTGHTIPTKLGGEDVETCLAIKLLGYEIYFSDTLKFYHKFDVSRLNESFLISNNQGTSAAVPILELYRTFIYKKKILFFGQIIFHLLIIKKIIISLIVLIKIYCKDTSKLDKKMGYSTLFGIISGYILFFNKLKYYSEKIKKLTNNSIHNV